MISQITIFSLLGSLLVHAAPAPIPDDNSGSSGIASLYGQCGGINWTGATQCDDGSTCVSQNDYYYQCLSTDGANAASATTGVNHYATVSADASAVSEYGEVQAANDCFDTTEVIATSTSLRAVTVTSGTATLGASEVAHEAEPSSTAESSSSSSSSSSSDSDVNSGSSKVNTNSTSSSSSSSSLSNIQTISGGVSGTNGKTTYYWDCCAPNFVWTSQYSSVESGVTGCDSNDQPLEYSSSLKSGCQSGGNTFSCSNQHAYNVSDDLAYGFAAGKLAEMTNAEMACTCFKLTFTSSAIAGKEMVVQITNTGSYSDDHHFDLAMPGGGVGDYTTGCTSEFGSSYTWGKTYGGISSLSDCDNIPAILQEGCRFRFQWLQGADNPTVSYEQVVCPSELTNISGCTRNDE
ncbi:unnamed protein product [Ambrosiozyma monospora]|uniref:Unnamed protein product n=1 Tax=Ambrosiozyma monospora TaxID=43982 RepID=A0ACB5SRX8_AMBMO|nr:unnamed protein product [Ambrosiozyma monospora]